MTLPLSKQIFRDAWIAPMDGPVVRDGAVVTENDRIAAVGNAPALRCAYPNAEIQELGEVILLPGLINAHVHLEMSEARPGKPPASLASWILQQPRSTASGLEPAETVRAAVANGIGQCLRYGVTSIGDISKQCSLTRPLLKNGPVRVTSYGEVLAMAQRRALLAERFASAGDGAYASKWLRIGLSPHSSYTVEPPGYLMCLDAARRHHLPLATHLAETTDEAEFLAHHTGPFRDLWEAIGQWDDHIPTFPGGPIRFAQSLGLLDYPTLLAHVNYCDDAELAIIAAGRASVVYCPRTHRYFGHPPHRWRDMLAAGINVALGTDSCASSPDLNLVDDLRMVHQIAPEFPVEPLWELVTTRAARAIEAENSVGSLTPGKLADFVAFPVETNDPLREILENDQLPCGIWIGGNRITPTALYESRR